MEKPDLKIVRPTREDLEQETLKQAQLGPEVTWDKAAPTAPPGGVRRDIPDHLADVMIFFQQRIADEAVLLDLCFTRAMEIVQQNILGRMVGIDHFGEEARQAAHPAHTAAIAGPITVELYRQTLKSICEDHAEEYTKLVERAQEKLRQGSPKAPGLILPS